MWPSGRRRVAAITPAGDCADPRRRCPAPASAARAGSDRLPGDDEGRRAGALAEAVYEDVGEMDGASRAGLKASATVAAGIGAYLYTALEPWCCRSGPTTTRSSSCAGPASAIATATALPPGIAHRASTRPAGARGCPT